MSEESVDAKKLYRTLRMQSWERAKAELNGILHTYDRKFDLYNPGVNAQLDELDELIENFIKAIEKNL